MADFLRDLTIQTWVMYGIAVVLVFARIESRRIVEGSLKRLWIEEYLMLFVLLLLTANSWTILEVAKNGSNYVYLSTPDVARNLGPTERRQTIYGSKMTMVLEYLTLTILWTVKITLCLMFYRLTNGLPALHKLVKLVAVFCGVAYVLIIILFTTTWCRPFEGYWALPVQQDQCATYYHHLIFATPWNISADLMLLTIPFRIIPGLQLPMRRKVLLLCVLGLGVFNILAAILNRYYNFAHPDSVEFLKWYVGEFGTAVYVVNVPACWPLLRKILPGSTDTRAHSSNTQFNSYQMHPSAPTRRVLSESEEDLTSVVHHGKDVDDWSRRSTHVSLGTPVPVMLDDYAIMPANAIIKTVGVQQHTTTRE
nr:hypothetical protein B0A51_02214 [Rachicladosporium sp. CCFEE 5018]